MSIFFMSGLGCILSEMGLELIWWTIKCVIRLFSLWWFAID